MSCFEDAGKIVVYPELLKGDPTFSDKFSELEDEEANDIAPPLEKILPLQPKVDLNISATPVGIPHILQTDLSQKPSSNPTEPTKIPAGYLEIKRRPREDNVLVPERPPTTPTEPPKIQAGSPRMKISTGKPAKVRRPTVNKERDAQILIPFLHQQVTEVSPKPTETVTNAQQKMILRHTKVLLPIISKNPSWISETSTITSADPGSLSEEQFSFIFTIFISPVMFSLAPTFIPVNLRSLRAFIEITKNNQPMFMLFGVIHVICVSDLIFAFIEGVLLWKEIPKIGCEILGACRIIIFFGLSLILMIVCLLRISAILTPRQFKRFMSHKAVLSMIAGVTIMITFLAVLLIETKTLIFQYEGPPRFLGCTLFVAEDIFQVLAPILITIILLVNLVLACTCWVLYRYFKNSDSVSIRDMKREALFVTSLSSLSYFLCHVPSIVTKVILFVEPDLIMELESPYLLLVDFILILCFHLYSCLLPLCLVTSKAIDRVRLAAERNRLSRKTTLQLVKTEM